MSVPPEERSEHPSTYFVQDRSNQEEFQRIRLHDHLATAAMDGVLAEQPDPGRFHHVLDVGCGIGGWLIEVALAYPHMTRLDGVDISRKMIDFARKQASEQGVSERVTFSTMDALRMLEFPAHTFDLTNQRSGAGYLRTWDWPKLLQEYRRVTRPGGIIRITEGDWAVESNSPALTQLFALLITAFYNAGHTFTATSDGITKELEHVLVQNGLEGVQTRRYARESHPGTLEGDMFIEDMKLVFRTMVPFLHKWTRVPDNYNELYQQMLSETGKPDFVYRGSMLTAWGINPSTTTPYTPER